MNEDKRKNKKKIEDTLNSCKRHILFILDKYNCSLETDLYHNIWLNENSTGCTKDIYD